MEYINHYTVNTSHNRTSYPTEIDKSIYMILKNIIRKAESGEKSDVLDGTYITMATEQDCYVATLWADDKIPLLITVGASTESGRLQISKTIITICKKMNTSTPVLPAAPVIADIILPSIFMRQDVAEWTGDFTRCLGWAMIAPEKIR